MGEKATAIEGNWEQREREREEKPQLECNEKVFQNIYC